jgi:Protein of unknown function (DUF3309)
MPHNAQHRVPVPRTQKFIRLDQTLTCVSARPAKTSFSRKSRAQRNPCGHHSLKRTTSMSLGYILLILLVIFLLGGFSGRFGGYGYGYGHGGVGVIGVILIVVVVLLLTGRL